MTAWTLLVAGVVLSSFASAQGSQGRPLIDANPRPAADLLVITPSGEEPPEKIAREYESAAWMEAAEALAKSDAYELWKLDERQLWVLAHVDAGPLGDLRNAEALVDAVRMHGEWLSPTQVPDLLRGSVHNPGSPNPTSAFRVTAEEFVVVSGPDGEMEIPLNENLRTGRRMGDDFVGRLFDPRSSGTGAAAGEPTSPPRMLRAGLTLTPYGPASRRSDILLQGLAEFNRRHELRMEVLATTIDRIPSLRRNRSLPPAGRFGDLPSDFVERLRFFEGAMASWVMDAESKNPLTSAEVQRRFDGATSYRFVRRLCLSSARPGIVTREFLKPDLP
ncbi:MAG: hypothetical protein MH204_08245 [Fimbriimonadaceae bacterium]|nr:hypothetical protein [Fimbriimonadaceae bacterium]